MCSLYEIGLNGVKNFITQDIFERKRSVNLPHSVVEAAGPEFGAVGGYVDAGRAVCVSLELPH